LIDEPMNLLKLVVQATMKENMPPNMYLKSSILLFFSSSTHFRNLNNQIYLECSFMLASQK